MKTFLAIIINKFISFLFLITRPILRKDGTVLPGYFASKIDKHVLDKLKYPSIIIGVTGSSGKGSTTRLIAKIIEGNGYKVLWNKSGSNLYTAATTLILNHTNPFTKKINTDVLLLELDESYIKDIFNKVNPTHLVITNITRDQVARNGEPDVIFKKILSSIDPSTHLILNANDPVVMKLTLHHPGEITKYGILKYRKDYKVPLSDTLDQVYCPVCRTKLKYHYYHYGNIGSFICPTCKFGTNPLDYKGTDINLQNNFMTINDHIVKIDHGAFFTCYATLAAYAVCNLIGLEDKAIMKVLNKDYKESNKDIMKIGRRKIEMIDSKPENALSYEQTLDYINEQKGINTVVIGFDNVSRRYNLNDISWMYDINFDKLNNPFIYKIYCIGRFRYDIALRLKLAGINDDKVIILDDYEDTLGNELLHKSKGNIYNIVFVDMMENVKDAIEVANE